MRKITLTLTTLFLCMSTIVWAQSPSTKTKIPKLFQEHLKKQTKIIQSADYLPFNTFHVSHHASRTNDRLAEMFADTTIISECPTGKVYPYVMRDGFSFANTYGGLSALQYFLQPGELVEGDDGAIYLKNAISQLGQIPGYPSHYLKLDKVDDTTYIAHLPQPISYDYGRTRYACRLVYKPKPDKVGYALDTLATGEIATDVTFKYKDGVLRQLGGEYVSDQFGTLPSEIIGQIDSDGGWYAYGDAFMTFDPIEEKPTVLPSTATVDKFVLTYNSLSYDGKHETRQIVNVGHDGDSLYIQNPITYNPNSWIKGVIKGDKVVFNNQYVGTWDGFNLNTWIKGAKYTDREDSTWGYTEYIRDYEYKNKMEFAYDAKAKTLTGEPDETMVFLGDTTDFVMADMGGMSLYIFEDKAAKPAKPVVTGFSAYNSQWGSGFVSFDIPDSDTEGNILDPSKLFYQIYFDSDSDHPFAVTSDIYTATLPENEGLSYFPWGYNDGYDIIGSGGASVTWYYYTNINEKLGIQSFYEGGNTKTASDITWLRPKEDGSYDIDTETGIHDLNTNSTTACSTYYDLQGRMVKHPGNGIFIRRTIDSTGNVSISKVILK